MFPRCKANIIHTSAAHVHGIKPNVHAHLCEKMIANIQHWGSHLQLNRSSSAQAQSGNAWEIRVGDPDSKVHGANMRPTWVLSAPDGPHVGPMNLAIRVVTGYKTASTRCGSWASAHPFHISIIGDVVKARVWFWYCNGVLGQKHCMLEKYPNCLLNHRPCQYAAEKSYSCVFILSYISISLAVLQPF